jgi:hypothetical protein
MKLSHSQAKK